MSEKNGIYSAMSAIMKAVTAIEKDRRNQTQGYNFRGIDDVYNVLHDVMANNGVFCLPSVIADRHEERTNAKGTTLIYRVITMKYTFVAYDGSSVEAIAIGEGMDSGDKAANKAMSAAQKYALLQTFLIPTEDDKDSENDSHSIAPADDPERKKAFIDAVNALVNKHNEAGAKSLTKHLSLYNAKALHDIAPAARGVFYTAMKTELEPKN